MPTNDAAARAKISASRRGQMNNAMWGRAHRVDVQRMQSYSIELGRRIRDLRLERDISIAELAAASGVNFHAISRIENGASDRHGRGRNPLYLTIVRLALALGVSPSELMPW